MDGTESDQPTLPGGIIDESERRFSPEERRIAEVLQSEGKYVKALPEIGHRGRFADAEIGDQPISEQCPGVHAEFKALAPGASSATVRNVINNSIRRGGQARHIIIYSGSSGLTQEEAIRGLARAEGITRGRVDSVRIIGDGFDVTSTDFQ